jgi:all-trans-8'-apo-beta-carotenal 15,15'-oxygenase
MIDGKIPDDLVGCLYRNGPGKFGVGGDRVEHVLDADGLVIKVLFPPKDQDGKREFKFMSRFVETEAMKEEERANEFLYRSTFGTGPRGYAKPPRNGLNEDPWQAPLLSKIVGNALKVDIKNSANTQVISFGGKVLALFEAGLPHQLDPETLKTIGEDTLGGVLKKGSPVKLGKDVPEEYVPDFLGGTAHTAHPNVCPDTGNLVGWHWSQLANDGALEVTFTEWSKDDFSPVATETFQLDGCELAPHDMALTENCIMLKVNALKMNTLDFLSGAKGPAASLAMDGRSNVFVHVFPRPTAKKQFEPYVVEVPACFSIHFSHAYEDEETGNLVSMFSGWPPSDEKDFLGAWGGFAPLFKSIPITMIWKLEIDPVKKECVHLGIAPGAANACAEHCLVHPNFNTKKAKYVYAVTSNLVGDSSAPCGYSKFCVEDGAEIELPAGVKNEEIDSWFFGSRYFAGEPLIIPKEGADPEDEEAAFLLGMVQDCANDRSGVCVFDLERDLKEGPVATAWLKSSVPHGLHGCFAQDGTGSSSVFC